MAAPKTMMGFLRIIDRYDVELMKADLAVLREEPRHKEDTPEQRAWWEKSHDARSRLTEHFIYWHNGPTDWLPRDPYEKL